MNISDSPNYNCQVAIKKKRVVVIIVPNVSIYIHNLKKTATSQTDRDTYPVINST